MVLNRFYRERYNAFTVLPYFFRNMYLLQNNTITMGNPHNENCSQDFMKNIVTAELAALKKKIRCNETTTPISKLYKQFRKKLTQELGVHRNKIPAFKSLRSTLYKIKKKVMTEEDTSADSDKEYL